MNRVESVQVRKSYEALNCSLGKFPTIDKTPMIDGNVRTFNTGSRLKESFHHSKDLNMLRENRSSLIKKINAFEITDNYSPMKI